MEKQQSQALIFVVRSSVALWELIHIFKKDILKTDQDDETSLYIGVVQDCRVFRNFHMSCSSQDW